MSPARRLRGLKDAIKARRGSSNPLVRSGARTLHSVYAALLEVGDVATDPMRRSFVPLRWFREAELHQASGDTGFDRYPAIFAASRRYFEGRRNLNLLSFGCSTGEEVVTLRNHFQDAFIVGVEINPRSLAICRARSLDDRIVFLASDRDSVWRRGPFDAIFCLAVLQRHPSKVARDAPANLAPIYPFARFDDQIRQFERMLKPGGLLVVHAKAYRVEDSTVADRFLPLENAPFLGPDGPKYGPDERPLPTSATAGSLFVKA